MHNVLICNHDLQELPSEEPILHMKVKTKCVSDKSANKFQASIMW
jgi:hypothetical protein